MDHGDQRPVSRSGTAESPSFGIMTGRMACNADSGVAAGLGGGGRGVKCKEVMGG